MRTFRFALLSSSFLAAATLLSPVKSALAAESMVTLAKSSEHVDVLADGTFTATYHHELLARNDAAARQIGQATFPYDELTMDGVEVAEAYTLKADGTKLPVDGNAIFTQAAPSAQNITSLKQKMIVFPRVVAGDRVIYTVKVHLNKPTFPGHFATMQVFSRTVSYEDWDGNLSVPSSMPLGIEAHGLNVDEEERGSHIHYHWHYSAPNALAEDIADVALIDRNPRLFLSSFRSYDELASTYAETVAPLLTVTPKVQALADTITDGIGDRRSQAQKIYEWVGHNIRYVSIHLGVGGFMPHAPEEVLANGYGDCKDHAVLLGALLEAKGIDSDLVLINVGNSYTVPRQPSFVFDHMINWIPEFKLYADSTSGIAPFGGLTFAERGKTVVHLVAGGNALHGTRPVAAGEAAMRVTTTAKLDADGNVNGETENVGSGPFGLYLRFDAEQVEAMGWERAAARQLKSFGIDGIGRFDLAPPASPGREYKILGRFSYSMPQYLTGAGFSLPSGLRLLPAVGDFMMGPLGAAKLRDSEPTPCFTGTAVEDASLEIPASKRVLKLPADITVADSHLRFTTRWTIDGRVVSVHRQFSTVIDEPLCRGEVRKEVAQSLAQIRKANQLQILSLVDTDTALNSASN